MSVGDGPNLYDKGAGLLARLGITAERVEEELERLKSIQRSSQMSDVKEWDSNAECL